MLIEGEFRMSVLPSPLLNPSTDFNETFAAGFRHPEKSFQAITNEIGRQTFGLNLKKKKSLLFTH